SSMLWRNPRAALQHFWWNWRLVPVGLQVLLFNSTSADITLAPDYPPVVANAMWPRLLLVLLGCCWIAGIVDLVREWGYLCGRWLRPRLWGWVGMLAVAAVAVPVISTQRPRPSYLFALSVFLLACTAMSVWIVLHRWRWPQRLAAWAPLAMMALIAV